MTIPNYLPTVDSLIPFERMPDQLGFLRSAIEPVFARIFYRDLFIGGGATAEFGSYDLTLVWFQRLALEVPGSDGLALVLFPDEPGSEATQVQIAFGYHWPILRYLEFFDGEVPVDPQAWLVLFTDIFGISPADLLFESVSVLIEETDPFAVFAENFPGGSLSLDIPPGEDFAAAMATEITGRGVDLPQLLFTDYIQAATAEETLRRLVSVFRRWIGDIDPEHLFQIVVPQVFAELVSIPIALEFPRSWMIPLNPNDTLNTDPQVRSRITFNAGKVTFSSQEGLQFQQQGQFSFSKSDLFGTGITLQVSNGLLRFENISSDHPSFRVRGAVELTFPASMASTESGQPLVVTTDAEVEFESPGKISLDIRQFNIGGSGEALAFFPPGLDGFGLIVDSIETARVTAAIGPGTTPHVEMELSVSGFRIRLPRSLMVAVTKGFNIDQTTMRRLRQTPLPESLLDELEENLLDLPFDETSFVEELDRILETAGVPNSERPAAKQQILAYAVNWIPEVDGQDNALPRDLIIDTALSLRFDSAGNFAIDVEIPTLSLQPVMLGEGSGVVIEATNLTLRLDTPDKGLSFDSASLYLPPDLPAAPDLTIDDCFIGGRGFSGTVTADWVLDDVLNSDGKAIGIDGELTGEMAGFAGGLSRISLTLVENFPTESDIRGKMMLPGFEGVMDVQIALQAAGSFTFTLLGAGEEGVELTQEELIRLNLKRLTVAYDHGQTKASLIVSGGLEPLLMASDGLEWPRLDVTDLSVEKNLAVLEDPPVIKLKEAWLDLKDLATLDLFGFYFELNRIGIGYEETTDKLWLDLTGSIRLIELIPIGLGVEGFRITWPRLLYEEIFAEVAEVSEQPLSEISIEDLDLERLLEIASKIEVRFDGLYLFYGVPQAVEFEGLIRFIKEAQTVGFAGDVALRMPASGFAAEAGLMVGINFAGDPALPGIPLPYLYVYLGIELPTGIPLGQSGLALKGALGLFGLNVAPDKTPSQNWYYDWYKRDPFVGVHQTNKWRFQKWSIAFGAGITITTTGTTIVGVRGLLALVLPGPIIIIEGRALIFEGLLPLEPPLRALAVFDGPARTIQLNIEAEGELVEGIVEAYAMAEAFFDFKDLTNWHLYLGQEEPADRRIRANLLKLVNQWLFDANAFLMLDMINSSTLRARLGVFVGFEPPIPPLGPVSITLNAVLEGEGLVTVLPEHFSGRADLSATIGLSAFGFNMLMDAGASVATEGASPLIVDGLLYVRAEFPSPIEPFDSLVSLLSEEAQELIPEIEPISFEVELSFHWESPQAPAITAPLSLASVDAPRGSSEGGSELPLLSAAPTLNLEQVTADASPIVSLDARPTLVFDQDMMQGPDLQLARHPDGALLAYSVGPIRFTPFLDTLKLYRKAKAESFNTPWELVASSDSTHGVTDLWGVWMADTDFNDAQRTAARRLRIWTDQPFHNPGSLAAPQTPLDSTGSQPLSYQADMLRAYPEYYDYDPSEPEYTCVDFARVDVGPIDMESGWTHRGINLHGDPHAEIVEISKSVPVSLPRFSTQELWKVLRKIDPRRFRLVTNVKAKNLRKWAPRVPASQQIVIRKKYGQWTAVWDWLWPRPMTHRCLWLSAKYIKPDKSVAASVHCFGFEQRVTEVRIELCDKAGFTLDDIKQALKVRRRRRTIAETEFIRREAERRDISPDYDACRFPIDAKIRFDGRVIEVIAIDGSFECICLKDTEVVIKEVCFITEQEQERHQRAADQDEINDSVPPDQDDPYPVFLPGYFYKLQSDSQTLAELQPASADTDPVTDAIYRQFIFGDLDGFETSDQVDTRERVDSQLAYFQTSGPPHNLRNYIKWTSPSPQAKRIFRDDDFAIRFRRHYVSDMFDPQGPWAIAATLFDVGGNEVEGYVIEWQPADSATLTPDEQAWLQHLGHPETDRPRDDLLRLVRDSNTESLHPGQRYELRLAGGAGGVLLHQDDFAETDPNAVVPLPPGWQRMDGVLRRSDAPGEPLNIGVDTWTDIDFSVDISLQNNNDQLTVAFRDFALPAVSGGVPIRQYFRLRLAFDLPTQNHALTLEFVTEPPSGQPVQLARSIVAAPVGQWRQIRIRAIDNRLSVWFGGIEQFDIRLAPQTSTQSPVPDPAKLRQGSVSFNTDDAGVSLRRLVVRDAVLHRIPFVTSKFANFSQYAPGDLLPLALTTNQAAPIPNDSVSQPYVDSKLRFEHAEIDYIDQTIDREYLETQRLSLRQAAAALDSQFRELAESLQSGLVFQPLADGLQVYVLRSDATGQTVAIWLRHPESLDLRFTSDASGENSGRTVLSLNRNGQVPHRLFTLADSTQAIVVPANQSAWPAGTYTLKLMFARNYGDETRDVDHRYDRPILYPAQSPADNTISLQLQL